MGKTSCFSIILILLFSHKVQAFCGFFVAKAGTNLFNRASKVVLVRDDEKTVVTMASDYKGDPKDFALVVPVPVKLEKGQIHIGDSKDIERIDEFTAPRLVEYRDTDPCEVRILEAASMRGGVLTKMGGTGKKGKTAEQLGVKIEAEYTVGEYDILILSAKESNGLQIWLDQEGYKTPKAAKPILKSYIKQDMKFFVAKVNLKEMAKTGEKYLRPIQMAYDSPKFMLPVRLGTVNSEGAQELFIFALTKKGRVEPVNYPMKEIPSGQNIPLYVKNEFPDFYKDMFSQTVKRHGMGTMYMEYAWDMGWCDPCAADPLTAEELRKLGVFWVNKERGGSDKRIAPGRWGGGAQPVYVTRIHARYTKDSFPEDPKFIVTSNKKNYQGRYVLTHYWKGKPKCEMAEKYLKEIDSKKEKEATNLAYLTGRDRADILTKMGNTGDIKPGRKESWWDKLWGK